MQSVNRKMTITSDLCCVRSLIENLQREGSDSFVYEPHVMTHNKSLALILVHRAHTKDKDQRLTLTCSCHCAQSSYKSPVRHASGGSSRSDYDIRLRFAVLFKTRLTSF